MKKLLTFSLVFTVGVISIIVFKITYDYTIESMKNQLVDEIKKPTIEYIPYNE